MKQGMISILAIALLVISAQSPLRTEPSSETLVAQAVQIEALARKSGCLNCHAVDKNVVGPAYQDVAARYKGDASARAALIESVKNGGKGKWTKVSRGVPMPPHSATVSDAEIQRLVDWVLSLEIK